MSSNITPALPNGLILTRYSNHYDVEVVQPHEAPRPAPTGITHVRCTSRKNIGSLVAGDAVFIEFTDKKDGVITARAERSNVLERPDNFGRIKPVAANIDQMLVVIAPSPKPQPNLIDRYLVAASQLQVEVALVVNKSDLPDTSNTLNIVLKRYAELGYPILHTVSKASATHPVDLSSLTEHLHNKKSIFVGQSGVGKSSLINALQPEAQLDVGELSVVSGEGTHTTTRAMLIQLASGGRLIDSPGIRDFGLWHVDAHDVQRGFIEIDQAAQQCKFRDCRHQQEPGCAVLKDLSENKISLERFASFNAIKQSMADQHARGLERKRQ